MEQIKQMGQIKETLAHHERCHKMGSPFGLHRVIEPQGALPQESWKLDNSPIIWANEILVELEALNIDAASFTQMKNVCLAAEGDSSYNGDSNHIANCIAKRAMEIVNERGKHHNPETGSGGVFLGRIKEIGEALNDKVSIVKGDQVVSLVSLTITPLFLSSVIKVLLDRDQLEVKGHAVLFERSIYAKIPEDFTPRLTMAALDVAGAAAQTARLVQNGDRVLVIGGGGKAGLLVLHEAKKKAKQVIAFIHSQKSADIIKKANLADSIIVGDATNAVFVMNEVEKITNGKMADLTINCVNVPGTEMASILASRDQGIVYFFSMATSFTKAALGAEGAAKDVTMIVGNGFVKGHAETTLNVLRENKILRQYFEERYG